MGYSRSVATLRKAEPLLQPLLGNPQFPVVWRTDNPDKTVYKLREAMAIAREFPEQFPELARLAETVTFRASRAEAQVVAVRREQVSATVLSEEGKLLEGPPGGGKITVPGRQTAGSIVQAMLDSDASQATFPEAHLDGEELTKLFKWSEKRELIFFEASGAITVQPASLDPEAADFAWNPEDLQ